MTYQFTKTHPLGTVWVSDQYQVGYLNIPCCASESLKPMMAEYGAVEQHHVDPGVRLFTVVRDPFDRLVTAINRYAVRYNHNLSEVVEDTIRRLQHPPWQPFDEHSTPQWTFMVYPIDMIVPLESLTVRLPAVFEEWGLPTPTVRHVNRTPPEKTLQIAEAIRPHYSPTVFPLDTTLYRQVSHSDTVQGIVGAGL